MKKLLVAAMVLATGSVFAQNYYGSPTRSPQNQQPSSAEDVVGTPVANPGVRHMLEFSPEAMEAAVLSFDRIKSKGSDADSGTNLNLDVNYAYGITQFLQAGARFHYLSGLSGANPSEGVSLQLGAIMNFDTDFTQAAFVSLYLGAGFQQQFGNNGSRDDLRLATLAVGKRFPLTMFGVKHISYTPEVALQTINSTTNDSLDYSQSLEFRFLQFSVFF
jgi:hypothetical protein